jgi:SAM-dependent methyltransferase
MSTAPPTPAFRSTKDWEAVFAASPDGVHLGAEPSALTRSALGYLRAFTADVEDCVALDLGCGEGRDTVYLASAGLRVHAHDIAPTGIANARMRLERAGIDPGRVDLTITDIRSFDYPADTYDLALAANVYQFLGPDEGAGHIELLRRTVKRGGVLGVGVFSPAMAAWGTDISPYFTDSADDLLAHFPGAAPGADAETAEWRLCDRTEYWTLRNSDGAYGSFAFVVVQRR